MRRSLSLLVALSATLAYPQQARPDWPQPIIRGTVIVWAGEQAKETAMVSFQQRLRGAKALVLTTEDSKEWSEFQDKTVVKVPTDAPIPEATAIWIDSWPEQAQSGEQVLSAVKAGGLVALSVESLANPRLKDLLPYVSVAAQETDHAMSVRLLIEEGAVLIADGRNVSTRGEGRATFTITSANSDKQVTVVAQGSNSADLVALRRRAIDLALDEFPPKQNRTPDVTRGTLMIIGGGGVPEGLLEKFIEEAGGPDAPIVYVPCEFAEQISEPGFVRLLRQRGAKNVTWIHTKDRDKANGDQEFLAPLKDAKGVWFGGGRQWNLVDSYLDTAAHDLMRQVLEKGGVIAGSSAGASIQAEILARGDPLRNTNIIAPGYLRGLGFLPGVAVDQHFSQRSRHKDMTEMMTAFPQILGIGIDESTAIIVKRTTAEVTGMGRVFFYDYTKDHEGDIDYAALKSGEKFDLAERKKIEGQRL